MKIPEIKIDFDPDTSDEDMLVLLDHLIESLNDAFFLLAERVLLAEKEKAFINYCRTGRFE